MGQPIIRGIQAVGAVGIKYTYNSSDNRLTLPDTLKLFGEQKSIDTSGGVEVCGFRLDGEFLRAIQQIATSVLIPILGGGAVALTNNNRSGTLNINCTKVSTPDPTGTASGTGENATASGVGQMYQGNGIGPDRDGCYDLVFLAQAQQGQVGGDSVGATIDVAFTFCGLSTVVRFEGCTIASVDPLGLAGNDAPNYGVAINYLNWRSNMSIANGTEATIDAHA